MCRRHSATICHYDCRLLPHFPTLPTDQTLVVGALLCTYAWLPPHPSHTRPRFTGSFALAVRRIWFAPHGLYRYSTRHTDLPPFQLTVCGTHARTPPLGWLPAFWVAGCITIYGRWIPHAHYTTTRGRVTFAAARYRLFGWFCDCQHVVAVRIPAGVYRRCGCNGFTAHYPPLLPFHYYGRFVLRSRFAPRGCIPRRLVPLTCSFGDSTLTASQRRSACDSRADALPAALFLLVTTCVDFPNVPPPTFPTLPTPYTTLPLFVVPVPILVVTPTTTTTIFSRFCAKHLWTFGNYLCPQYPIYS